MLALWALLACTSDEETSWVQYNGDADELTVEVGTDTTWVAAGDPAGDCASVAGAEDTATGDTTTGGTTTTGDTGTSDTGTGDTGTGDTGTGDTGDTGEDLVPAVAAVALTSSTGTVTVGWGCASPSAGPVGTDHTIRVQVFDDYEAEIGRVSVRTDSGDRGEDEYDLEQDSADPGAWVTEIESVGEEGEQRSDTLTFRLWSEDTSDDEE